jgi:hypothetical protein
MKPSPLTSPPANMGRTIHLLRLFFLSAFDRCIRKSRNKQNTSMDEYENVNNIFLSLKVPKREIFDLLDFPDFYTMKSLRVGDFGVKIKKFLKNI